MEHALGIWVRNEQLSLQRTVVIPSSLGILDVSICKESGYSCVQDTAGRGLEIQSMLSGLVKIKCSSLDLGMETETYNTHIAF